MVGAEDILGCYLHGGLRVALEAGLPYGVEATATYADYGSLDPADEAAELHCTALCHTTRRGARGSPWARPHGLAKKGRVWDRCSGKTQSGRCLAIATLSALAMDSRTVS